MLWEKRILKGREMYTNLLDRKEMKPFVKEFHQKLKTFQDQYLFVRKDNQSSHKTRTEGNKLFEKDNYEKAIGFYNSAITYAEAGSEEMGICYANRSACFFELKQYSLCLMDIELAKQNNYPLRLKSKLDRREEDCLKLIENYIVETELWKETPKLSFEPHLTIPCFANVLEVTKSEHIITNTNLEIGQTIIIERAMTFIASGGTYMDICYCRTCFKENVNLIPCETCLIAMFCSNDCYNAGNTNFHQMLCNTEHFFDKTMQHHLLRSIIFAINTFSTIEHLMTAIEQFRKQRNNSGSNQYSNRAKRQYFQFFGLRSFANQMKQEHTIQIKKIAVEVAMFLKHASKLKAMFESRKIFQFLLHLSLHHMEIIWSNSYNAIHYYTCSPFETVLGVKDGTPQKRFGSGLAPYSRQLKHSCTPNICRIFINDTIVYRVIRPIKRGEQLFISYLEPSQLMLPTSERKEKLSNRYHFQCSCMSCKSNYPPFKTAYNKNVDELTSSLIALMEDGPNELHDNKLMHVNPTELRKFENAVIDFLRSNDQVHPTQETLKMQYLLIQIWNLMMR